MRPILHILGVAAVLVATLSVADADAAMDELATTFTGRQVDGWRKQTVDDLPARLSPIITADGDELNHHRVTVEYTGSGTVKVSVAHARDERWDVAIDKRHLHSRWQDAPNAAEVRVVSPYKGERFAWVVLHTEGDVTIRSVRHVCYRGKDTLYGHIPLTYQYAGARLSYRLMLPSNYDPKRKYPLVISVAGSGSVGTKNVKNMEMVILARHLFTQYRGREEFACFSLVPQIPPFEAIPAPYHPRGPRGAPDQWHPTWPAVNADGWFTQATISLIRTLLADRRVNIDADRVYFTGFSYGGKACWEFLKAAPDLFAGAICGGGWPIGKAFSDPTGPFLEQLAAEVSRYRHVPVLIFAGGADRMRFGSKAVHKQIQAAGGVSKYVEIPNVGHVASAAGGWGDPKNIQWLFARRRPANTEATEAARPASQPSAPAGGEGASIRR